ncbi:MAG TPA: alpha/beta hydrolase [Allosphingosinicella sp.]|nr:alpha/beta hydrolase [Allosphingosinicella sp.]
MKDDDLPPPPGSISPEAQAYFAATFSREARDSAWHPAPDDPEGWVEYNCLALAEREALNDELRLRYPADLIETSLGGVPVVDIRPAGWRDDGRLVVYTHGGGYVGGVASDALDSTLPIATETGLRIVSVSYTLAPHARYEQVTDEACAVIEALVRAGTPLARMAVLGDSAGGGLAAATALKLRDRGIGLPAGLALWSPWTDLTGSGDSYLTLAHAEPFYRYDRLLAAARTCYVGDGDPRHPYASPLFGDFTKGFPETLIQVGTRELLLSDSVRLARALDEAGQAVTLDVYEGMWHVFQFKPIDMPEAALARRRTGAFLNRVLGRPAP